MGKGVLLFLFLFWFAYSRRRKLIILIRWNQSINHLRHNPFQQPHWLSISDQCKNPIYAQWRESAIFLGSIGSQNQASICFMLPRWPLRLHAKTTPNSIVPYHLHLLKEEVYGSTEAPDYCQLMKISPVEQVFGQWHTIIFKYFLVEATSRSHLIIGVWSIAHQSDVKDLVNKMNCYTEHRNERYALFFSAIYL